ncbi:PepSY domain-containing protein [Streptomyces sp. FR-108]|uniref:PepSY domain-containing protein n=1 Tax=Streptomyces sp. FR-108 TaxID=3416665 RepID=UPI003CEBD8E7
MKRASLVLLTSGALVAAITGTALAGGSDDTPHARGTSSASASATATATEEATDPSGLSSDAPTSSASPWQSHSPSGVPTTAPTATAPAGSSVGSRRAGEIALSHVGGGTLTEIEAETEHGRAVWSVKILRNGSRYEVHVDRGSGEITRSRSKSDDDHGDAGKHGGAEDDGRHGSQHD